jgi:peptide/nickel transport system substrate-binding protein
MIHRLRTATPFIIYSAFLVLFLSACKQDRDLSQNTVIVHFLAEPAGLHPVIDRTAYTNTIFQATQKRLITLDLKTGELVPEALIENPQILPDSISYLCKIREDLFWDNGAQLSLNDIFFTFKAMLAPCVKNAEVKSFFANLIDVKTHNGNSTEFIIQLKERYFDNLLMLSEVVILQEDFYDPKHLLRDYKISNLLTNTIEPQKLNVLESFCSDFNSSNYGRVPAKMNGLGPYKVSEWQTGSYITLVRKPNVKPDSTKPSKEQALPERIIFRIIRDMEPTVLAFKKQQIDFSSELSSVALSKLKKRDYFNDNYDAEAIESFTFTYMGLNMRPEGGRTPYFTDVRVRKAIAHIIPIDEIIHVVAKGQATRLAGYILPKQTDYDPNVKFTDYSREKAEVLLDDAGWIDTDGDNIRDKLINGKRIPFSFALSYMVSPVTKDIALMIRSECIKVGIDARPDPMEFSYFYQRAFAHEFDAMLGAWSKSSRPDDPRQLWHSESWASHGSNFTGFGSAYTDSLIEAANRELNPEKRKLLTHHLQQEIIEQHPYVFLFNASKKVALHKRFSHEEFSSEKPHIMFPALGLKPMYSSSTADHP